MQAPKFSSSQDCCGQCEMCRKLRRAASRELQRLQVIIADKLHLRRCHVCQHQFYAADGVIPYCNCDKCGSQDTRRAAWVPPLDEEADHIGGTRSGVPLSSKLYDEIVDIFGVSAIAGTLDGQTR